MYLVFRTSLLETAQDSEFRKGGKVNTGDKREPKLFFFTTILQPSLLATKLGFCVGKRG